MRHFGIEERETTAGHVQKNRIKNDRKVFFYSHLNLLKSEGSSKKIMTIFTLYFYTFPRKGDH